MRTNEMIQVENKIHSKNMDKEKLCETSAIKKNDAVIHVNQKRQTPKNFPKIMCSLEAFVAKNLIVRDFTS